MKTLLEHAPAIYRYRERVHAIVEHLLACWAEKVHEQLIAMRSEYVSPIHVDSAVRRSCAQVAGQVMSSHSTLVFQDRMATACSVGHKIHVSVQLISYHS